MPPTMLPGVKGKDNTAILRVVMGDGLKPHNFVDIKVKVLPNGFALTIIATV